MNIAEYPWAKIFIILIGVSITVIEVWEYKRRKKKKKWEKIKKPIIIGLSMILLILSVFDEVDTSKEQKEAENIETERRNQQIIQDSIRASRIITDLGKALNKIDSSTQNLGKVDNSINIVRDVVDNQVKTLRSVVSKTKEVQNSITGGDSYVKFYLVKSWRDKTIHLFCAVVGKYPMSLIDLKFSSSSFKKSIANKPIQLKPLLEGHGTYERFEIKMRSLDSNLGVLEIATFKEEDFKENIQFSLWVSSINGLTLQKTEWKNHKKYFSAPRKSGLTNLTDDVDWSGKEFEYTTKIDRVKPVDIKNTDPRKFIDKSAGIYYYKETYTVQLKYGDEFHFMAM
ncbi:hypothetical protein [Maribacter sp. 2210JD10-5]|uniref:hypothetical protein n=1 Tax=Maribacter sp. 2210JD10-5 TaxID=3386272 RepID=UPI0039BC8D3B